MSQTWREYIARFGGYLTRNIMETIRMAIVDFRASKV